MEDAKEMSQIILDAVQNSGQRLLLSKWALFRGYTIFNIDMILHNQNQNDLECAATLNIMWRHLNLVSGWHPDCPCHVR